MATKKSAPKKAAVKKEKAPAPVKKAPAAKFVRYSIKAVIPTQQYGNIQPEIVVEAPTLADARAFAEPAIEEIYQKYGTVTTDGVMPKFFNKAVVTEVEKKVDTTPAPVTSQNIPDHMKPQATAAAPAGEEVQRSIPFQRANDAILNCVTLEALDVTENQIKNSVKLGDDEKSVLYTFILQKRKEFKK